MRADMLPQELANAQAMVRALQEEIAESDRGQVALVMELEELKTGALSESELQYRTLADSGQDLIWSSGPDKKCDYFNRAWLAFTGRTLEQELGDGWAEGVHPDDRTRCFEIFTTAFDRRKRFSRDYRLRRHDGEFRWIQDDGSPRYDSQGNFLGCIGHCLEITERKREEENLRRMATVVRDSNDAITIQDFEGRITAWNRGAELMYGFSEAEALLMNIDLLTIPGKIAEQKDFIRRLIAGEAITSFETQRLTKDGRVLEVWMTVTKLMDDAGKPIGIASTERDITERKREEENLRRMATVVRDSNDAITIQDFEGRITAWNRGAELMYGFSEAEALLMNIDLLTIPGKIAEQKDFIRRLIAGEAITSFETQRLTKDGRVLDVWMTVTKLVDDSGKPVGLASTERDITERLRNERLALRTQRLESLGTLTGGIAHDMNNSLAPIMMGVDLLRKQYPQESKILNIIEASAKRGADMVRHLLGFAKGVEGEHVSLLADRLLDEMENIVKGSFPKNIQLVVRCDPELPSVLGDATQIHQVLLNLCVNARDAMPRGGTLTLEVERREVDATYASSVPNARPGQYLMLRVSDTGSGMQTEILDRIFDPFFTTKGPDKGTGLGLSTVAGIVKGHGGFLQVYSHPGIGSTFAVYLPAERAGIDADPVCQIGGGGIFHGQGETILFVDDEFAVREVACEVLQQLNFKPLTATDGTDGLMQAAQYRTELRAIITDLHMPHLDGLAFVRALRQMLPDIPVVVASGRMEDTVAAEFKTLGVTTRLDKPFTEAQLAAAMRAVFQK